MPHPCYGQGRPASCGLAACLEQNKPSLLPPQEASGRSTREMYLHKFWGLVTVYKSNTRLKAVKKKKKAWLLGQKESVSLDHWGTPGQWDSRRLLLTLISMTWTCWAGFQDEPACGL